MTKILVTGGTGYIGSHTVVELQQAGFEVVIIDNLSNSNIGVLDGIERITGIRPAFVEGDVSDMATLRRLFEDHPGIRGIINFAASKAVGESVQKPILYYRNNLVSLLNLLEWQYKADLRGDHQRCHPLRRSDQEHPAAIFQSCRSASVGRDRRAA